MRTPVEVARQIQDAVPREWKGMIEGLLHDLNYTAPEIRWWRLNDVVTDMLPSILKKDWHFKVASMLSTKTEEELREMQGHVTCDENDDEDDHVPSIVKAWTGDKVMFMKTKEQVSYVKNDTGNRHALKNDVEYTVEKIMVFRSSSILFLKEFPGEEFNAANFEVVQFFN